MTFAIPSSKRELRVLQPWSSSCESQVKLLELQLTRPSMIHALECKHFSRGLFQVDLRDNKVLLWCAVVLTLTTVS